MPKAEREVRWWRMHKRLHKGQVPRVMPRPIGDLVQDMIPSFDIWVVWLGRELQMVENEVFGDRRVDAV